MKKIYSAWGFNKENKPHTLVIGKEPLIFANGQVDSDCEKLFYCIEACSWEEAMAIYHLRQGYEPYNPNVPAESCPQCGNLFYPNGSGQCWQCDYKC